MKHLGKVVGSYVAKPIVALCAVVAQASIDRPASAETISTTNSGGAAQALWTTCPSPITSEQICTFTAMFATRGTGVTPVAAITMAYLRVYPSGYAELLAYASGILRSGSVFTISAASLSTATVNAPLTLGEACIDPFQVSTCAYTYPALLRTTFTGTGGTTTWSQTGNLAAPSGLQYTATNGGGARSATLRNSSARFNNVTWTLGRSLSGLSRYNNTQTLTCPGACPSSAASPGMAGQGFPLPPTAPNPPESSMQDWFNSEALSRNIEQSTGLKLNQPAPPSAAQQSQPAFGRMGALFDQTTAPAPADRQ
jgi:hypothetical protein